MNRDRVIQISALAAVLFGLTASAMLTPRISAEAGRSQLAYTVSAEEGDPPEVALGVAMGAFKGLFVNILWMRAQALKEEGKFYDANEVARTITKLTPRFPRVWSFHAWNLAYNISVATKTPQERWDWVQSGIRLLRNEGIPKNPAAMALYKELSWIYVHKIQGFTDDANHYYKQQVAREWSIVLGPPPPDPLAEDADVQELFREQIEAGLQRDLAIAVAKRHASTTRRLRMLNEISSAADSRAALFARDEHARELVTRIENEAGLELGFDLLRYVELLRAQLFAQMNIGSDLQVSLPNDQRNQAIEALLGDETYTQAWRQVLAHTRKRLLVDDYHMEIPRMMRYTRTYGPIDWRHPAAHALYWAVTGVEKGAVRENIETFDITNTDRMVLHAVQELFRWGDIQYDLLTDSYLAMYNLEYVDVYGEVIAVLEERATFFEQRENRAHRLYGSGYENHLRDVVRLYFRMGETALAQHYYETLRNWPGLNVNDDATLLYDFSLPLSEFVKLDLKERMGSPQVVEQEMNAALHDAFVRGILRGRPDVFTAQVAYASQVHKVYMEKQNIATPEGGSSRMGEFFELRFVDVLGNALARILISGNLGGVQAAELWRRCPLGVQQAGYDPLMERGAGVIPDINRFFPEPPGMERYRAWRAAMSADDSYLRLLDLKTEQQ